MEWDQFHLEQTLKSQGWHFINPRSASARWGTTLAFKTSVFQLEAADFGCLILIAIPFADSDSCLDGRYEHAAARLKHTESGNTVAVVSCHLPFSGPTAALCAILQHVSPVLASAKGVVVCGDFNSTDAGSFGRILPEFASVFPPNWPTSRSPHDTFISIDYLWCRDVEATSFRIEPDLMKPNGMRLVAHASGGTQTGDYFSDHCVLSSRLRFK